MAEAAADADLLQRLNNIILIGMPGSGKSTLGQLLADRLKAPLVDTDRCIERHCHCRLQTLIDRYGLDRFLREEEAAMLRLDSRRSIIATGGSVVYSEAGMRHLQQLGTLVWLAASCTHLEARIHNMGQRGLALQPGQTFQQLFDQRTPLYQRWADIILYCPNCNPRMSVEELLLRLRQIPDPRPLRTP